MTHSLFHGLVVLFYVVAIFGYSLQIIFRDYSLGRLSSRIFIVGFLIQTGILVAQHVPPTHNPFVHGEGDFYYAASWILGFVFILFRRIRLWGILLVPLATILMIMALTHPEAFHVGEHIQANPWALIHFLFMSLAFALFAVGFILGVSYLLQRSFLKRHRTGWLSRWLPPLEVADDIHAKASTMGFLLLTAGMLSGTILSKETHDLFFTGDHRQIAALFVWVLYALFLNIRVRSGWHGRKGILLSVLGFVAVILAFLTIQHGGS